MTFNKNDFEGKQRFSIRKLNIGVCSVLLSTLLWTMNTSQTVHADTTDPVETEEVESAKKTTTDTGNDQTTTADKNDNDTTAQKEVSGTDPLTSKNSTEQNSTKQAEDKKSY
ncbi:YSIRK-type signal peptide-containing protein [Lactobacillus crispatus]|uniref:YSIRK-type signal peptide-containing protein n=2 Tax=Lactobacillus crispatus TaxID=47770 RepID=A0AAW6XFB4_9LACO|nr:YSIRK-type signal peptide-containing protein [Lactobacillus crispatus]MDK6502254.1 YSIRK-type signal peptide-containing protein [Lactobacillus crispatus]